MNTINKVVRLRKMKQMQFFCINGKTYIIDAIDEEHKRIHLIQFEQSNGDNSISLDFDECVYDSISDGSSIEKAWPLLSQMLSITCSETAYIFNRLFNPILNSPLKMPTGISPSKL